VGGTGADGLGGIALDEGGEHFYATGYFNNQSTSAAPR
jgi:hypothetical protein